MGYISYRLNQSATLATMVPPALPGGAFGPAALPAGMAGVPGIYMIINCQGPTPATHNRYIGISNNIGNRFTPRMSVVTELGFLAATMGNIYVVWGSVKVRNHPLAPWVLTTNTPNNYPPPAQIPFPNWGGGGWTAAVPAGGGAAFTAVVDGNVINLEHLLIRFAMTRMGAGGTVSNNMLMVPFPHPMALGAVGAQPLIVKFQSAGFGPYPPFTRADRLTPGFVW